MSGPVIQRVPPGLLGYFGIKNGGMNPTNVSNTLLPQLDMLDWYMMGSVSGLSTGGLVNAIGLTTYFTVPDGEYWYVHGVTARATVAAAGRVRMRAAAAIPFVSTLNIYQAGPLAESSVATDDVTSTIQESFWAPPGARFGLYVEGFTGAFSAACNVTYARVPT